ncbi:MAG TPA: ferric siderophore ABC transporter substrate-binding protein, partial [Flavobacterium sp.]
MSKLSIYETSWIDLVFENRNKEYGAYQLRRESAKTSIMALFMGILLLTSALSIPIILNYFNPEKRITLPDFTNTIVNVTDIIPNQLQEIEKPVLPEVKTKNTEAPIQSDQLVNPEIVQAQQANQDIAKNTDNTTVANTSTEGTATVGVNPISSGQGT